MRIHMLAWRDTVHDRAGGSELVVHELADRLAKRGHDVTVFHGGPSAAPATYRSISVGGTYDQYLRMPVAVRRRHPAPDVIVDVSNGIPYFSPLWHRAPTVLIVHHVHTEQWGDQFGRPIAALGRWLESSLVPRVYRRTPVVVVSDSTRDALVALGVDHDRIDVVEMGVTIAPSRPNPAPHPRFLVLGRLVPHKRVDLVLKCWERVRPLTGGELVIVGAGPESDRLRRLAGADVRFLGGIDDARKRRELGAAWLLVHAASHEGWGIVIMEAAAAGVPTVAFDVPGVRDAVVDAVTGRLAATEDELVEHWVALATDAPTRSAMGRAAAARAGSFGWDRSVDQFETVLRRAVDRR